MTQTQDQKLAYADKSQHLVSIIKPLRTASYEIDVAWTDLEGYLSCFERDYGAIDLNPDFQRGHVWTPAQQQAFIENTLRGVISTNGMLIQFNCSNWGRDKYEHESVCDLPNGFQCIDGLQRLTAVRRFMAGEIKPFGFHVDDLTGSEFSMRRGRYRFRLAVHDFQLRTDLLRHYLDLNAGGTPHMPDEIERVKRLLIEAKGKASE